MSAPGHALTAGLRAGLSAALTRAAADDAVEALAITGAGARFCDGAVLSDYDQPEAEPTLSALCAQIEDMPKPTLAILHGAARGPGLELALAAHYRIAEPATRLAMPEAALGLVPSGGATQRLPRLLGAAEALALLLRDTGGRRANDEALRPLIDAHFDGDRQVAGIAFLRKLLQDGSGPRPTRDRRRGFADPMAYQQAVTHAAQQTENHPEIARREIVRAVEAAQLLPFEVGCAFEAELAEHCRQSRQARALRHLMRAERAAARPRRAEGGTPRAVDAVGIVGAGPRVDGLAALVLRHGWAVRVETGSDPTETRSRILAQVDAVLAADDRLLVGAEGQDFSACQLLIEATASDPAARAALVTRLAAASPGAVIATTGAGAALEEVAQASGAGWQLCGLTLRDPVLTARLVEVSAPAEVHADALATLFATLRALGRVPVLTAPRALPAGQEMMRAWQAMALSLADHGVHPHAVDAALRAHGHAAGPFQAMEAEGLAAVQGGLQAADQPRSRTLPALIEAGRGGPGQGIYLPGDDPRRPIPDDTLKEALPVAPTTAMPGPAIVHLANAALANRGARLLRRGVVERASDLDVAMVAGWGYPRLAGGPMKSADLAGLFSVQRLLEQFARTLDEPAWMPDRLLRDMVKNGRTFSG